jgi:hypothetical protein
MPSTSCMRGRVSGLSLSFSGLVWVGGVPGESYSRAQTGELYLLEECLGLDGSLKLARE